MNYTSKELSQKIKESGFSGESEMWWADYENTQLPNAETPILTDSTYEGDYETYFNIIPAYDLIYDVCIKYAKEFWGIDYSNTWSLDTMNTKKGTNIQHTKNMFFLLQQGKQEKVEQYFLDNSILFNK